MQNKDKLSKKDIYNRLWTGRDFEIEHLWQRSIFLGAFLILFFTVYFTTLGTVFSNARNSSIHQTALKNLYAWDNSAFKNLDFLKYLSSDIAINICLLAIAILGFCFSILWILMAKGSKYWYEKYESSIDFFQNNKGLFDEEVNREREKDIYSIPMQGYLQNGVSDDRIFSRKGGAYSMSKVNVSIGQIFAIFWSIVIVLHFSLFAFSFGKGNLLIVFLLISFLLIVSLIILLGEKNRSDEASSSCCFRVFCNRYRKDNVSIKNQQGKQ